MIALAMIVLLLGPKKFPTAARELGRFLRIVKAETSALCEGTPPPGSRRPRPWTPASQSSPRYRLEHRSPDTVMRSHGPTRSLRGQAGAEPGDRESIRSGGTRPTASDAHGSAEPRPGGPG
ncbi:twin-arginine translocase TatA/TatE family subunit [Streptomyces sp. BE303]|uniref:twin-arginine translocase TatA/TatE family subunit n=1 Tax=Streptomyces sp. BE303 TaxID=3002528 RepID=UPI002E796FF7|nr:twin-arginine translocase TatA/TatE family subunit [Streptomyces sp. BE303]MED7950053.1 twin-arginine translocase TatA/TatE family subunit [Streptomyces sp. BE303]